MHNDLKSFKKNPTKIFCKNLINFEKSQNLSKTQNLGKKIMKCMIQERNKIIPNEENLIRIEDQVGNVKRLSLRSLWEKEVSFYQERLERMRENRIKTYI